MKTLRASKYTFAVAVLSGALIACAGGAESGVDNDPGRAAEPAAQEPTTEPAQDQTMAATQEQAAGEADVSCEMSFTMEGWSAIVTKAEGEGTVSCDNGQSADVVLEVTGGGLTAGKTEIDDGRGVFSDVEDISEIFGAYAQAEASAGAVKSASAQALTKGEVSLAITAQGRGWSLGVSGAKFSIERADDTGETDVDA